MTQIRNDELVRNLTPDFQKRYEANFSFAKAASVHLMLPQLRGYWPFSSVDENGDVFDLSAQGRTLTNNGTTPFATSILAAYADFDGTDDRFNRADTGLNVTGGISFGGWYWLDVLTSDMGLMGKWDSTGNQRAYLLQLNDASDEIYGRFSFDGTAANSITSNFGGVTANTWFHVVLTGEPDGGGYNVVPYLNGIEVGSTSTGLGSALHTSTADFQIGAFSGAANFLNGRACQQFLCATRLSEEFITAVFQETRAMFGI